jgi:DNA-3-methyladenine glycosylase
MVRHNGSVNTPLTREFFARAPETVARELVGCVMIVAPSERVDRVRIVETEAYAGAQDPASHAYRGPTPRTAIMFGPAGFVYVYLSYGIHWCLNIVTGEPGTASAVLLRGAVPVDVDRRAGQASVNMRGPGLLTRALGITKADNGQDVCAIPAGKFSFTRDAAHPVHVGTSERIGISKAQDRPWRFFEK